MKNQDVFPEKVYECSWGYKYLIHMHYLLEDRKSDNPCLTYKHQIRFSVCTFHVLSLILRTNSKGILFIRNKEIH